MPTDCSVLPTYEQAHVGLDLLTLASYYNMMVNSLSQIEDKVHYKLPGIQ